MHDITQCLEAEAKIKALEAQVKELKHENKNLYGSIGNQNNRIEVLILRAEQAEKEGLRLQAECQKHIRKIEKMESQEQKVTMGTVSLCENCQNPTTQLKEWKVKCAFLEQRAEQAECELIVQKDINETNKKCFREEIKDLTAQLEALKRCQLEQSNSSEELVLVRMELEEAKKEIDALVKERDLYNKNYLALTAQLEEKQIIIDDLCDKWEEAKKFEENAISLMKDKVELQKQLNAVSEEEWDRLKDQNARLKEENEKFLEELADIGDFADPEQSLMNILMTIRFQFEALSNQREPK